MAGPPAPAPSVSPDTHTPHTPNRILVVADEEPSRELCREFLLEEGYGVEACDRGRKALTLLAIKPFDVVLTDLTLPEMDGCELVRQIRYSHPGTDVVVMSAFGSVSLAVESMRAGAYDYIVKPFPRGLLKATVRRCLENHNLKREISKIHEELVKKDKLAAVGSMAGAIAHRMRNPLSIILMCAQYLEKRLKSDVDNVQVLKAIEEKVRTLEQLTRDFVEFSRASRIRKSPERIERLAEEVIRNVLPRCKIQRVHIATHFGPNLPVVTVDADLIREVFTNIIDNGLEAMKGAGDMRFSVARTDDAVDIRIENTGSVLADELAVRIFEPFFTTKETGMGLGLAIVKQVIEGHGGRIEARGNPATQTTEFRMVLPLGQKTKETA